MLPEPVPGYMDRYGKDGKSTWVQFKQYNVRPTWQELYDLGMKYHHWLQTDGYAKYHCFTASGSCLVAVTCYHATYGGTGNVWYVFAGTIPRGPWRDYMDTNAQHAANDWFKAAGWDRLQERIDTKKLEVHAEDTALFRMNEQMRGLRLEKGAERIRLVVVGTRTRKGVGLHHPCYSGKTPSCEEVANGST